MNIEQARFNMIEQQIRPWNVLDLEVLDLLHVVKREQFVPAAYPRSTNKSMAASSNSWGRASLRRSQRGLVSSGHSMLLSDNFQRVIEYSPGWEASQARMRLPWRSIRPVLSGTRAACQRRALPLPQP